jgi:hypothetical protein
LTKLVSAICRSTSSTTLSRSGVTSGRMLGSKLVVPNERAMLNASTTLVPCLGSTAAIEPTCKCLALFGQTCGNGQAPSNAVASR